MMKFLARIAVTALLPLSFVSYAGEVDVGKLHKTDWISFETPNFILVTDASEKKAAAMAEELEHFYFFVSESLGYDQSPLTHKVWVVLAKKTSTLEAMGIPEEYGGVFLSRPQLDEFVIFANADRFRASSKGGSSSGRSIILHELMHLINRNESIGLASPPWYNEGIAEYFGTYTQKRDKIILGDLSLLQNRFYSILRPSGGFERVATESLFKTAQDQLPIGGGSTRQETQAIRRFYARSAAVVHYLSGDPERRRQMYIYLNLIHKGYGVDESFEYAFEMTYDEFDDRVDDYLNGRYVMARTFPIGKAGIEFPEVPFEAIALDNRRALQTLISKIALFDDSFLGAGNREKMIADARRLLPGSF